MEVSKLIVTHNSVREPNAIVEMAKFVKDGGFFNSESINCWSKHNTACSSENRSLIRISKFPDGKLYIHDGHHRCCGVLLGGRNTLREDEYEVHIWDYENYMEIRFERNWLTPFDPREEVRNEDFYYFKRRVWSIYNEQSPNHAYHLILTRPDLYKQKRKLKSVHSLLSFYEEQLNEKL